MPCKPSGVMLGEAREKLQRALLFGSPQDIADAEFAIEQALDKEAEERLARNPEIVREVLEALADRTGGVDL